MADDPDIRIRFGPIKGTAEECALPASVWRISAATLTETDAFAALTANLPTTILNLKPGTEPKDFEITERSKSAYQFVVTYRDDEVNTTKSSTNTVTRRAATLAKSIRRYEFDESVGVYDDGSGTNKATAGNYAYIRLKIDANTPDSHYYRNHARTFEPLPETQQILWYPPATRVTKTLLDAIEDIVGAFNDDTYLGRPAGSLQLVRFEAAPRSTADWEFAFGYGYRKPRTNFYSGDIKIPIVRACDYYYTVDQPHWDSVKKILQPKSKLAVAGRVWPLEDLTATGLSKFGAPIPVT